MTPLFVAAMHPGGVNHINPAELSGVLSVWDSEVELTHNGSVVETWGDAIGGSDITQATAGSRPPLVASWRAGKPAVGGAAGKSLARTTFADGGQSQPGEIWMVGDWDSTAGSSIWIDGVSARWIIRDSSGKPALFAGSANSAIASAATPGAASIARAVFNGASSFLRVAQHGQAPVEGTISPGTATMNGIRLGAATFEWDGATAYILRINRVLNASEAAATFAALGAKYGIVPA